MIEMFRQRYPNLPQVVCFGTAFHRTMPRVAPGSELDPRRLQTEEVFIVWISLP